VPSYACNIWKKLSMFSFEKCNLSSHIVFIYDCAILRQLLVGPTVLGSSVRFFLQRNYVIRPTIVLSAGHFSTSAKFHEILHKYQNSVVKGKFHGSAQNSTTNEKLWVQLICLTMHCSVLKLLMSQVNRFIPKSGPICSCVWTSNFRGKDKITDPIQTTSTS